MTDTPPKPYLELWPESWSDEGATVHFQCPVLPCGHTVQIPGLRDNDSPLMLLIGTDPGPNPHPVPEVAEKLMDASAAMLWHIEQNHDTQAWLVAVQAAEDHYEEAFGQSNLENDRAWANVRSAQEALQTARREAEEARSECAELLLVNSANLGALAAVQQLVLDMTGDPITPNQVALWRASILQVIGQHEGDQTSYTELWKRVRALEDARLAILRYLDLFQDTLEGTRRTVQAFLGEMPHEHDRTVSALDELRRVQHSPNVAHLFKAVDDLLAQLDKAHGPAYHCPASGETESPCCGGFDTCCDQPELHTPANPTPKEEPHEQ